MDFAIRLKRRMNWSKELPPEYEYEFDPTDPDAPAEGDGLPVLGTMFTTASNYAATIIQPVCCYSK